MAHDIKANKIDVKGLVNKSGERISIANIAAYLEDYKTLEDFDLVHKKYIDALFAELSTTDLAEIFFDNIEAIKDIGDYAGGVEVVDLETAFVYRYNVLATEGIKPNDNMEAEGRWVQVGNLRGEEVILTPENTTVYDNGEIYEGGNIFVSYVNEAATGTIFETAALYRSRIDTAAGISPEDSLYDLLDNPTGKWEYQGAQVVLQDGGLAKIFYPTGNEIKAITGYKKGNNAVDIFTGKIYEYSEIATVGIKPNDSVAAAGRWVEVGDIGAYNTPLRIINVEEGSNITLDADSGNTYYRYKGASPITVTVPNTIPLALPFAINQMGVGTVTLQGASGVVLTTANLTTGGQGFGVTVMKVENNLVDVIGGVE